MSAAVEWTTEVDRRFRRSIGLMFLQKIAKIAEKTEPRSSYAPFC